MAAHRGPGREPIMSMTIIWSRFVCSMLLCSPLHAAPATTPPIPSVPIGEVAIRIPAPPGLANPSRFGIAVALEEDRLFIGCDGRRDGIPDQGRVLVFEPDELGIWIWTDTLVPPDSEPGDEFGSVLALDGDHLVIGAPGTRGHRGAAWCVELDAPGDLLQVTQRIPIADASPGDRFGESVAIHRGIVAVGAPRADVDGFLDRGRVVTASMTPDGVRIRGEPVPGRPKTGLRFGWSLAIGSMLDIGAPGADVSGPETNERVDRAGIVIRYETEAPHPRIESHQRPEAKRLERFGTCLTTVNEDALLVGSPRAFLNGVRCGVISLVSSGHPSEIGAPLLDESALGEPLVGNSSIFAAGMPGRRDDQDRPRPGIRLGGILSGNIVPRLDLLLEDRERTLISLSLSPSGEMLAIGSPDPAFDDGPEVPGEVHLVRIHPMLRPTR